MPNSPRILLLEDDDEFRDLLAEVLEDEGFSVCAVGRGEAAVEAAISETFDLIIADIRMEGIGGLEAIEQTQQLQPDIGSVIVSGYASEQETARAEHLEVGAYLKKPFQMQELLQFVRSELATRSTLTQKRAKDSLLHQTLDWALIRMAEALDEVHADNGALEKAAMRAEAMAEQLELGPEAAGAARRATLLLGAHRIDGARLPDFSQASPESGPLFCLIAAELSQRRATADDSLTFQVVSLALEAYFPQDPQSGEQLLDSLEGRYSPRLLDVFRRATTATPEGGEKRPNPGVPQSSSRSLLSLAHTLERLGDSRNALRAYRKLTGKETTLKERIEGHLGAARLAAREEDVQGCAKHASEALRLARDRGPLALARNGLRAAQLLQESGHKAAAEALNLVGQACRTVNFEVGLALSRCGLSQLSGDEIKPEHVKALHGAQSSAEVAPYVSWLVSHLFRRAASGVSDVFGPVLIRTVQDYPSHFLARYGSPESDVATRMEVVKSLSSAKYLPESVITKLLEDPEKEIREAGHRLQARTRGKKPTNLLRVQSFGAPTLSVQGESLCESLWRTRKVKYLFFLLASRWGSPFNEHNLMDIFWPKASSRSKKNLYWATSGVRSVLKRAYEDELDPLVRFQHTLSLDEGAPRWHDLEEFRRAYSEGSSLDEKGDDERALERYTAASSAYVGPYLEGCYYDFAVAIQRETEEQAIVANYRASEIALTRNLDAVALEHATQAVELAPYREDCRLAKMRAQIRLGQGDRAVEEYEAIVEILKEDYDTEPTTELIELYHRARLGFTDA